MKKSQLKALATKIHGLAVKSANGKKTVQNKAIEKILVFYQFQAAFLSCKSCA
jgi:hypothetical protein